MPAIKPAHKAYDNFYTTHSVTLNIFGTTHVHDSETGIIQDPYNPHTVTSEHHMSDVNEIFFSLDMNYYDTTILHEQ